MYHDLLAFAPPGGHPFVTPLLTSSNVTIDWASTEWKTPRPILFPWPAPPCTTFFDYDRFKGAWNEVIKDEDVVQPTGPELVVERLAFAWLSIGTAVVTRESPVVVSSWGNLPWSELVNKLVSMAGKLQDHHFADVNRYSEWLRRVAELLMPEMGWPSRVVDHFSDVAVALSNVWLNHRLTIRQRRAERLKQFLEILAAIPPSLLDSRLGAEYTPTADMLDVAPTPPPPRTS
jgi:hypothetical protein